MPDLVLEGRLIRLEPLAARHVPALALASLDPRGGYHHTFVPRGEEETARYVDDALTAASRGEAVPFAIVRLHDRQVVGSTRFGNLERWTWPSPRTAPDDAPDAAEIGWTWLVSSAQGTGINLEAKRLLLAHAFETWRVHRITLIADVRNARSRAAIEKLGAKLDGILRAHFPAPDGTVRDSASYSILTSEWPAARARLDARLAEIGAEEREVGVRK